MGSLSAEAERGLSRVGQRALAPLVLSVSSSAQPASHVQPQTCTVAVRVEPWYDGDGPCPSEEVYASLVSCSDLGFGGARPLCLGGALPMSLTAAASPDGRLLQLRVEALVPTIELIAVALYALRVHPTTLSEALLHPAARRKASTGYLTMEQTRKLLLLAETDPKAFDVPLVGVWVAGVADVHDPFVWAACARFAALPEDVAQRVSAPGGGGAFLVLVYDAPPEARRAVPKLLEVTPRVEGTSHLLTARALEVQVPLGSAAAVRCDLVATSSEPLSRLLGVGAPECEHSIVAPPCLPAAHSALRAGPAAPTAAAAAAAASAAATAAAAAAAASIQTAPPAQVAVPAPAPPELPAGVLELLQQLHGQVAALTARAQEQDDTIAALTAQRTEPPTPVAPSTAADGGPPPPQRQPPPQRSQQAQQLADLSRQIAAEQQSLAEELHELRQRAADPAAESQQPGPARPTGSDDSEEAPPYSYLLMREAHGNGEEEEDGGGDGDGDGDGGGTDGEDAGRDADGDDAEGDADVRAWLPASALMADSDDDGDGDGECSDGGGGGGGGDGGSGLAALNPVSGGPATECSDDSSDEMPRIVYEPLDLDEDLDLDDDDDDHAAQWSLDRAAATATAADDDEDDEDGCDFSADLRMLQVE